MTLPATGQLVFNIMSVWEVLSIYLEQQNEPKIASGKRSDTENFSTNRDLMIKPSLTQTLIYQTNSKSKTTPEQWAYAHLHAIIHTDHFGHEHKIQLNLTSGLKLCTQV